MEGSSADEATFWSLHSHGKPHDFLAEESGLTDTTVVRVNTTPNQCLPIVIG